MFAFPVLIGDIGGTNARFAIVPEPGAPWISQKRLLTASTPTPIEAIRETLASGAAPAPRSAMIALANRVDSLSVRLTNAPWTVDALAIGRAFGLERVTLVNDYPPVAASVTALRPGTGDLAPIGDAPVPPAGTRLVVGPGTGLGAAALIPVDSRDIILATEAGHVEMGPADPGEFALWPHLDRVLGRVSAEALLSGPGLFRLAEGLARSRGVAHSFAVPNDVAEAAHAGDPLARDALLLFARLLGRWAGDLALTFEANGGVFIAGGIAPRILPFLQEGGFRRAFSAKAPHEAWASRVAVHVITHPEPALLGLSALVTHPDRFVFPTQSWEA